MRVCCVTENKGTEKKILRANGNEKKKAGIALLISDKIGFKTKATMRDKGIS